MGIFTTSGSLPSELLTSGFMAFHLLRIRGDGLGQYCVGPNLQSTRNLSHDTPLADNWNCSRILINP